MDSMLVLVNTRVTVELLEEEGVMEDSNKEREDMVNRQIMEGCRVMVRDRLCRIMVRRLEEEEEEEGMVMRKVVEGRMVGLDNRVGVALMMGGKCGFGLSKELVLSSVLYFFAPPPSALVEITEIAKSLRRHGVAYIDCSASSPAVETEEMAEQCVPVPYSLYYTCLCRLDSPTSFVWPCCGAWESSIKEAVLSNRRQWEQSSLFSLLQLT